MNKEQLVERVAQQTGLSKKEANAAIDATLSAITAALRRGEKVTLVGFGTFQVRERKAREGRNPQTGERMRALRDLLRDLLADIPELVPNTPPHRTAPHILNVTVRGVRGEVLVHRLEQEGVFVSTGSACHSRKARPSHVLLAMGRTAEEALSSIRMSLGVETTEAEVRAAAQAIHRAVEELRMVPVRR